MTEHHQRDAVISVTWGQTVFTSLESNKNESLNKPTPNYLSDETLNPVWDLCWSRVRVCLSVLYLCLLLCRVLVLVPVPVRGPWRCFCTALPRSSRSTPRHDRPWTRDRTSHCASLQTQAHAAVVKNRLKHCWCAWTYGSLLCSSMLHLFDWKYSKIV